MILLQQYSGASLLEEILSRGRALTLSDLKKNVQGKKEWINKSVEKMRRIVDVKFGRLSWRWIHTITKTEEQDNEKKFYFNPEEDINYIIVKPMTA